MEQLEDLLNYRLNCSNTKRFEVINLGVMGYDIRYSVERFIKRGNKYNPDLLIWFIMGGNLLKDNEYMLPRMGELEKKNIPFLDLTSYKYVSTEQALNELIENFGEEKLINYQLESMDRLRNNYSGKILLLSMKFIEDKYKSILQSWSRNHNDVEYYSDLTDTWRDSTLHVLDFHPNKSGHQTIAEDIFYFLKDQYLQSCSEH